MTNKLYILVRSEAIYCRRALTQLRYYERPYIHQTNNIAAIEPAAADRLVFTAILAIKAVLLPVAFSVLPGLKPNQPKISCHSERKRRISPTDRDPETRH